MNKPKEWGFLKQLPGEMRNEVYSYLPLVEKCAGFVFSCKQIENEVKSVAHGSGDKKKAHELGVTVFIDRSRVTISIPIWIHYNFRSEIYADMFRLIQKLLSFPFSRETICTKVKISEATPPPVTQPVQQRMGYTMYDKIIPLAIGINCLVYPQLCKLGHCSQNGSKCQSELVASTLPCNTREIVYNLPPMNSVRNSDFHGYPQYYRPTPIIESWNLLYSGWCVSKKSRVDGDAERFIWEKSAAVRPPRWAWLRRM